DEPGWTLRVPHGVREVLGRRIDRLTDACAELLSVASVAGRQFDLRVLQRATGSRSEDMLELLEQAVGARLIAPVQGTPGRFAFSHVLVRETLYEELSTSRRRLLHLQIGEALEAQTGGGAEEHAPDLARHFLEAGTAGDPARAVDHASRAADAASRIHAYEEAARFYEMALSATDLLDRPDDAARCDLSLALAAAYRRSGEIPRAREANARALGISPL